ncbi:rhodanese-like domain-containing protein [Membranihabitans maritimus]|uniref:rhodanese-like domain-containing protein n=1 Tax=Membranihabitans maritimus TaxID=2904244 RepID=UPI001F30D494|nr:rhodanese-like domain-containing protein [Membranihabitans maritimus]
MGLLSSLFGLGQDVETIKELKQNGAIIIDVRSAQEYSQGHISGSKNIPLNQLKSEIGKLKKENKPVLCCCASGNRSGMAVEILKANGLRAENGGGWKKLKEIIS